jgi:hypothetical protein
MQVLRLKADAGLPLPSSSESARGNETDLETFSDMRSEVVHKRALKQLEDIIEALRVMQPIGIRSEDQFLKPCLALEQRQLAQIAPVDMQQVEGPHAEAEVVSVEMQ